MRVRIFVIIFNEMLIGIWNRLIIIILILIKIKIMDKLYFNMEKCLVMFVNKKYIVCRFKIVNRLEVKIIKGLVVIVKIVGILLMVKIILFSLIRINININGVV